MDTKFTIKEFNAKYTSGDICLHEIFNNRYGKLKKCPSCKFNTKFHKVTDRKCYACQSCGYQLHPLADTIFHKSDTPLKLWFYAIFLFSTSKNGVSGKELERQLGVTYKTAWRMAKQIRLLFSKTNGKIGKTVEMDETYVGGRKKGRWEGKTGRGASGKTAVFGMVERKGEVRAYVIPDIASQTIYPLIWKNVSQDTTLMTDFFPLYRKVRTMGFHHKRINHSIKEYIRGEIHTNTIEGFWSQMKRSIDGTYHSVSPKYLQNYVNEFVYRYNLRHASSSVTFPSMISEVSKQVL